jgi:hypothetical protein
MAMGRHKQERQAAMIDETLAAMDHRYDVVDSLLEARRLTEAGCYDYMLVAALMPARPGGVPTVANTHRLLATTGRGQDRRTGPAIVLLPPEDDYPCRMYREVVRMTHGFMIRGVVDFIERPFPTAGRTLDRVIEKVLAVRMVLQRLGTMEFDGQNAETR